ncbi:hypothetical protein Tco_0633266 [Tanacetum coccineum]
MDSILSLGQKNTLAKYMILSGAGNRPPMLEKDLYDSWKSQMKLYMKNREHRRMIIESVEHGPLIWPTVEDNGVIRTKKYAEKIQADCDMKATNIILQGLPADIYSFHYNTSQSWAKRFMDKSSIAKARYNSLNKAVKESLINDMNIYKMKMEQFQVNTKFLNSLPPEWSKKDSEVSKSEKKRVAEEALLQESFKKLRTAQASGSEPFHQEKSTEEPKELSEEDLKKMLEIVPVEEFRVEALQTKYPIIDWEIHTEGSRKYWKIIRVGNITEAYQGFEDMLKAFDREDLDTLWSLVKEKFRSVEPTEDMERALWVELKRLYEPDKEDTLWKLQRYMHDPLTWRLYGSCAVHHVFSTRGHCIYMLPEKDYPLTTEVMMLMLSRSLQVEEDSEMARDLVKKIFIEANRSRS